MSIGIDQQFRVKQDGFHQWGPTFRYVKSVETLARDADGTYRTNTVNSNYRNIEPTRWTGAGRIATDRPCDHNLMIPDDALDLIQ